MSWPGWPAAGVTAPMMAAPVNPAPAVAPPTAAPAVQHPYSAEQWAQLQQQNWQQWAQWQQQYQQWHQQYGAEYQKSLTAMAGGVMPTMAAATLPGAVMPTMTAPPPPAPESKPPPPPPPEEIAPVAPPTPSYSTMPPKVAPNVGYSTMPPQPPPQQQQQPKPPQQPQQYQQQYGGNQPQYTQAPPSHQFNQRQNWGASKRPFAQGNEYDISTKRQMMESSWNKSNQGQGWEPPKGGNIPPQAPPPVQPQAKPPLNLEELTEAEKKFDKEFAAWEAQFNKWKEQNANHPDKTQYREYEKKWESWRNSLLERREQMRKKRLAMVASAGGTPPNVSKPPPNTFNQPPPNIRPPMPDPNINMNKPLPMPPVDNLFSKPPPTQNDEPLTFKKKTFPGEEIPESHEAEAENFLKPSGSTEGGIPGLDLVKEPEPLPPVEVKPDEPEVIESEPADKEVPGSSLPKGADLDAISKGINTILGDQKLLSMLTTMTQNQQPTAATPAPKVAESEQNFSRPPPGFGQGMNLPPPNFSEAPPKLPGGPYGDQNRSFDDNHHQSEAVNNFDDQTRMSFNSGHNEQETGYGGNNFRNNRFGNNRNDNFAGNNRNDNFGGNNRTDSFGGNSRTDNFGGNNRNDNFGGNNRNDSFGENNRNDNFGGNNRNDNFGGNNRNDNLSGNNRNDNFGGNSRNDNLGGNNRNDNFGRFGGSDEQFNNRTNLQRPGNNYRNDFNNRGFNRNENFAGRDDDLNDRNFAGKRDSFENSRGDKMGQNSGFNSHGSYQDDYNEYDEEYDENQQEYNDDNYQDGQNYDERWNEEDEDFDKYHEMFVEEPAPLQEAPPPPVNIGPAVIAAPPEVPEPPAIEEPLFTPEKVTDYEHKSLIPVYPEVALEMLHIFDYRHKPLNRIPYPQRPSWLSKAVEHIRQFDPLASRHTFERPPERFDRPLPFDRPPARYVSPDRMQEDRYRDREMPGRHDRFERRGDDRTGRQGRFEEDRDRRGDLRNDQRGDLRNDQRGGRRGPQSNRNYPNKALELEELSDEDMDFDQKPRDDEQKNYDNRKDDYQRDDREIDRDSNRRSDDRFERRYDRGDQFDAPYSRNRRPSPDLTAASNPSNPSQAVAQTAVVEDLICAPGRYSRPPRIVIILRGPPGSGKTYLAKLIKDKEVENGGSAPRILSLDDYFMVEHEKIVVEEGKQVKVKEMVYEYEAEMEESYRQSFLKVFKKTITDGYFPFIIVDNVNDKVKHFGEMWSFAKQNGFQVYICQLDLDPQLCTKRNIHNRNEEDIEECIAGWEPTPLHHPAIDATVFLQTAITEVEMEEVAPPAGEEVDEEEDEDRDQPSSMESTSRLDPPAQWKNTSKWTTIGANPPPPYNPARRGFGGLTWKRGNNRRR